MDTPKTCVKTNDVVGCKVKNAADENLGKIEEIILDKNNGCVRYVILSFGGFLGMGEKLFALPWKALHYDVNKDCFLLNIDKEKLENAPGLDKNMPNWANEQFGETIYTYYGVTPYWKEKGTSSQF
jgi:hypothetical protein